MERRIISFDEVKKGQFIDIIIDGIGSLQVEVINVLKNEIVCKEWLINGMSFTYQVNNKCNIFKVNKDEILSIEENIILDDELEEIWDEMENIPVDAKCECLDDNYCFWEKGTSLAKIWSWFDKRHSKGLIDGLVNK
ncbi:MAG: hypothetical protein ACLS2V_12575 [Clostridium paraputrificum]|uniref:hypothetical protein n=1 Tax=Clostridium sp. TaxID=1506 RepID=UPI0025BA5CCD|nr:hypothetical protein [Clostridium sp.]MBS5926164.1 hypothetical protein [Clostridium sp.]